MFKFRLIGLSITIMLLALSFFTVTAQRGGGGMAPNPTAVPTTPPDSDGDGVPDEADNCDSQPGPSSNLGCPEGSGNNGGGRGNGGGNGGGGNNGGGNSSGGGQATADTDGDGLNDPNDQCPTVTGVAENNGCPGATEDPCTAQTSTPSCEPTEPPRFPTDRCYVAPAGREDVNVRTEMNLAADILGVLRAGNIYEAQIMLDENDEPWAHILDTSTIVLANPADAGKEGYALLAALIFGNCPIPTVPGDDTGVQNATGDLVAEDTPLCHMSFGYDASFWSDNPAMGDVNYAAFWLPYEPGTEIPEGTMVAGVITVEDFIVFPDADHSVVGLTDPDLLEAAQAAADPAVHGWPTPYGTIISGDGTVWLPRLGSSVGSLGDGTARCGPIVAAGASDLVVSPTEAPELQRPIDELACTLIAGEGEYIFAIFAFNHAAGEEITLGEVPLAVINMDAPYLDWPEEVGLDLGSNWTAQNAMDGLVPPNGLMRFQFYGWALNLSRMSGAAGGTCGPIVGTDAEIADNPNAAEERGSGGVNSAFGDGSVRFVSTTVSLNDECQPSWIFDVFATDVREVFYCRPQGLASHNNADSSAPPTDPIACPDGWDGRLLETEMGSFFVCSPVDFSAGTSSGQRDLGIECREDFLNDIYETDVSDIFYCRPTGLANDRQDESGQDVLIAGETVHVVDLEGFGMECPSDWVRDVWVGSVNDVFFCLPVGLATNR